MENHIMQILQVSNWIVYDFILKKMYILASIDEKSYRNKIAKLEKIFSMILFIFQQILIDNSLQLSTNHVFFFYIIMLELERRLHWNLNPLPTSLLQSGTANV